MFWNKYPYTDFSQINLDWLVRRLAEFMRVFDRSGGLLPKFTKSDNGKVLTIKNGAAGWETPQETILVINVNNGTMDKTTQEIITAFESGIICVVKKSHPASTFSLRYLISSCWLALSGWISG